MMTPATAEEAITNYAVIVHDNMLSSCTDNLVSRKTVIYETLVDPTVIKVTGERLKRRLFTKFAILRSNSPIELISMEKYYEPYIVVSGRYFLNYYRLCDYTISLDNNVEEVILLNQKFYPQKNQNSTASIKLEGEERLEIEKKGFFMLAKNGQEANLETLPSAPSEKIPSETIAKYGITEIDSEADVDFVRKRLVQRPENISRIVNEVFEISERVVIYSPRFKLTYLNAKTYQEKSIEFDGVTSKRVRYENQRSRIVRLVKSALKTIIKK